MVYLNGDFMPGQAARISPRDRGFRFGDGVFETIPFYRSAPYQWDFHINRLQQGLKALDMPIAEHDWRAIVNMLMQKGTIDNGFIRISISRGEGSKGYRPLKNITPTVFVELIARAGTPSCAALYVSRWRRPAPSVLPAQKTAAQGMIATLALQEADRHSCDEALLLSHEEHVCEAASGNLFWIMDGKLFTPPLETGCLEGATRHALMRLYDTQEKRAPIETLRSAEAVFLTNCNWGILPVRALAPQGWQWSSANHPLIDALQTRYKADIDASI